MSVLHVILHISPEYLYFQDSAPWNTLVDRHLMREGVAQEARTAIALANHVFC